MGRKSALYAIVSGRRKGPLKRVALSRSRITRVTINSGMGVRLGGCPARSCNMLPKEVTSISFIPCGGDCTIRISFPSKLIAAGEGRVGCRVSVSNQTRVVASDQDVLDEVFTPICRLFSAARWRHFFRCERWPAWAGGGVGGRSPSGGRPRCAHCSRSRRRILSLGRLVSMRNNVSSGRLSGYNLKYCANKFISPAGARSRGAKGRWDVYTRPSLSSRA